MAYFLHNAKKFIKNVSFLNEFGVIFGFDLIYGLPGESYKGFKKGVDFALSMYPNNLEIFCLSVLPGTDLYDKAESFNLVFEHNPPYHIIRSDKISEKELKSAEELAEACCFFYNEGRAVPWFMSICRSLSLSPSAFLDKFAHFMKEKNINQKQLAEQSGITEASVSRYLNGERTPRIDIVSNFARVFGISVDEIISDEFPKMNTYDSIANAIARNGGELTEAEKEKLISLLRGDQQ